MKAQVEHSRSVRARVAFERDSYFSKARKVIAMAFKTSLIRRHAPAVVIMAAAFCAPAWAGPGNAPFKARVATQETLRPNPDVCVAPPYLVGTTSGTGTASHMGAITFLATDCVTPGPTSFTFNNGKLTVTAATGDELRITYSGTLLPIPGTQPFTLYTISGTYTVIGGSGRFSSASGSGFIQGSENIQTGQGQFDLTGTLSY
jgi:hypothetical protein